MTDCYRIHPADGYPLGPYSNPGEGEFVSLSQDEAEQLRRQIIPTPPVYLHKESE